MSASASSSDLPPVAVIGAGAVGTALARRLVQAGYAVRAVVSRTVADAEALAEQVGGAPASDRMAAVPPEAFDDIAIAIEGEEEALVAGRALADALGAHPVVLSTADKARYHCAAALASNGLAALMGTVQEVLSTTSLREADPTALFGPLVEHTWANLHERGAEGALTGPVARGDRDTVAAHLEALSETTPHLVPLYAALSTEMARMAVRRGSLAPDEARPLFKQLREAVQSAQGMSR